MATKSLTIGLYNRFRIKNKFEILFNLYKLINIKLKALREFIYSSVHDQLHPPPLASAPKFQIRYLAWLPPTVHGNCSEAARTFAISLPPQCRDLC